VFVGEQEVKEVSQEVGGTEGMNDANPRLEALHHGAPSANVKAFGYGGEAEAPRMKFGVMLGNYPDIPRIREFVTAAEALGFDAFFLSDHYAVEDRNDLVEIWTVLPYLAARTERIRLGTNVTPITFRPPGMLAKMVATADLLSGGRIILGVGAGWFRREFDMYSRWYAHRERVNQFREALQVLTQLWTQDKVTYAGHFYQLKDMVLEPKPLQKPHPPIWFGCHGRRMLRYAGTYGDGWVPLGPRSGDFIKKPEDYLWGANLIKDARLKAGAKREFTWACRFGVAESPRTYWKEIEEFKQVGLNYYVLGVREGYGVEALKTFADTVFPSL